MALGNEIDTSTRAARPKSLRMATPGKVPKVDLRKVAHHLRELHSTELSYYRKIHALYKVGLSEDHFFRTRSSPCYD